MTGPEVDFDVLSAHGRVASVPWSHLSVELGHLYMEDLLAGPDVLRRHFAALRPWFDGLAERVRTVGGRPARISTCFLVDDYFSRLRSPAELLPEITGAAAEAGLKLDYVARESGCAVSGGLSPAELVLARLVPDPPPGSGGPLTPPPHESGWLANGRRGGTVGEAMRQDPVWEPPVENAFRKHSVYMEVELFSEPPGGRLWSCAYLAAVWQLVRLGVLRADGEPLVTPRPLPPGPLPAAWDDLPMVFQVSERAHPFTAFRTYTRLDGRFRQTEQAVCMILGRVAVDGAVGDLVARQAAEQRVDLPADLLGRVAHDFSDGF